ncbi:tRNA (adenosine(37)-N6)-threonylcarbamoyltransferase complex dimerization subunit type 1 TsaB [Neorhodopirellula pilleata]|uniref:tRNA threonylcarbamoyladenosine biosynthesis protein TsaB n=1 Tax=Neorhodopirellula pilleata TaxID=2714738 RepID=A0A5C6AUJ1_9BACT|nr:tRNA (adenosine(37)-N6)-threonylcarbamoyltransferase complex dimerization subunit type 1 TsaB [Neorhodopirellula pilleata]TWU03683.1 tRNA threonylcarbamoyladenosine biosynthesis protein TsaB [Neorhodopirellula pilleata]
MTPKRPVGLAIEVIGRDGSVALMEGDLVVAARHLDTQARAASTLIPMIHEILSASGKTIRAPDYIAVAIGPGSFTGLRIAVTAAKTLAFAWDVPLVAVDSLAAIAHSAVVARSGSPDWSSFRGPFNVLVGLAAYRGQVFRGRFVGSQSETAHPKLAEIESVELVSKAQWKVQLEEIASSTESSAPWIFAGDRSTLEPSGVAFIADDSDPLRSRAAGVGRIGAEIWMTGAESWGRLMTPLDAVPNYFRPSAAEELNTGSMATRSTSEG